MKLLRLFIFLFMFYKGGLADDLSIISVEKGESFHILFNHSSVDYCWFKSPNKTNYYVIPDSVNKKNLEYEYYGEGFKNGDCGILIKHASLSDSGIWTGNIGSSTVDDVEFKIKVKVHETALRAKNDKVILERNSNITCQMYGNKSIEYCRFVRPDGYGVFPKKASVYYSNEGSNETDGQCTLYFKNITPMDLGNWTCIAKTEDMEYYDTILMYQYSYEQDSSTFLIIFYWVLYILALFGILLIFSVILCKVRLDNARTIRTI